MRYLRRQSTNARGIYGNKDIRRDINGQVVLDSTDMMLVPTGTTAQKLTSPVNGHMRYNTTTNVFENYQAGSWAPIRRFEPASIVMQSLGNGNDTETKFGPLNNGDSYNPAPAAAQNLIVLVENVFQLPTTNYSVSGTGVTATITFGSAPPANDGSTGGHIIAIIHGLAKLGE